MVICSASFEGEESRRKEKGRRENSVGGVVVGRGQELDFNTKKKKEKRKGGRNINAEGNIQTRRAGGECLLYGPEGVRLGPRGKGRLAFQRLEW